MKLTIITINYNNLEGLKKTAESVLNQTWRDFEWIIVDGGSSDGSAEYIEQLASNLSDGSSDVNHNSWVTERFSMLGFSADDLRTGKLNPHFSHLDLCPGNTSTQTHHSLRWCSEPDKGVYNAMNKGIALARGEYLNFMNSGDRFHENATLEQVFLERRNSDVIYGHAMYHQDEKLSFHKAPKDLTIDFLLSNCFCHQSTFIKRNIINSGYDENFRIVSDWKFWIECVLKNREFYYIDNLVSDCECGGISDNLNEWTAERANVIDLVMSPLLLNEFAELKEKREKDLWNPELQKVYIYINKRRIYKRILTGSLKFIELIDRYLG